MSAQALSRAGLFLGESLIQADPSNPDGHFEDIETVNLHDRWLSQNGTDWCHSGELPTIQPNQARLELSPIISRFDKSLQPWAIKDPRASLFLQQWQQALEQPGFIMAYRHYASCFGSLQRRQANELLHNPSVESQCIRFWQEPETALRSWLLHNKALLAHHEKYPHRCLLLSQEAQVQGESLVAIANNHFGLSLDNHANTGIDINKTRVARQIELPLVDSALREELEQTWHELQHASAVPAQNHAQIQWYGGRRIDTGLAIDELNTIWDKLGVAPLQPVEAISSVSQPNQNSAPVLQAVDAQQTLTVSQHFSNTDLNQRPQVHAVLRQLSTNDKIAFLELAKAARPEDPFVNGLLGQQYLAKQALFKAEACLAIATVERDHAAWFHMGLLRLRQDRLADAIASFEKGVSITINADHNVTLISTCIQANKLDKALQYCQLGMQRFEQDHRFASLGADIYIIWNNGDAALQMCLDNDVNVDDTTLLLKGFQILTKMGRADEALSLHNRASARDIVRQSDYRAKACEVLQALPILHSDRLQALWAKSLTTIAKDQLPHITKTKAA